eukprot:13054-Eustigmatos_ZCMA.PRE.1
MAASRHIAWSARCAGGRGEPHPEVRRAEGRAGGSVRCAERWGGWVLSWAGRRRCRGSIKA